jgi:arylsulfatase A-like enzyme
MGRGMRRTHVASTLLLALAGPATAAPRADAERPNVVLVYVDDLRHDGFAAAGAHWLETPELDRLAREGVMFERASWPPRCAARAGSAC